MKVILEQDEVILEQDDLPSRDPWFIQQFVGATYLEDLRFIAISRLRALGVVTPEMTEFLVRIGDVEQNVGLALRKFPNGGNWSQFICPCCGWKVRLLRLLDGALLCTRCCVRRGASPRVWTMSVKQRAEHRIPQLRAMLETTTSLRLKPVLRGTMERRSRLEAALARCEYIVSCGSRYRDVVTPDMEPEPIKTTSSRPASG
jgi:hypothetical protein